MPAGFQVFNNASSFLIDGKNRNIGFLQKGIIPPASSGSGVFITSFSSPSFPIVFFRTNSGQYPAARIGGIKRSGTTNTVYAIGQADYTTVYYWAFCEMSVPQSNSGLNVFNASGDLVFDANFKPLKIVKSYSGSYQNGSSINTGVLNPAFNLVGASGVIMPSDDTYHGIIIDGALYAPGGTVTFRSSSPGNTNSGLPNPVTYGDGHFTLTVADVEGL